MYKRKYLKDEISQKNLNPRKILPFWEVGIFLKWGWGEEVLLPHWKFWRHNCKLKMQEVHNSNWSSWKSFWEPTTKVFVSYCKYIGFNNVTPALLAPFPQYSERLLHNDRTGNNCVSDFHILTRGSYKKSNFKKFFQWHKVTVCTNFKSDIYIFTTYSYLIEWLDSRSSR